MTDLVKVRLELLRDLHPLALLDVQHDPEGLSRLVRPELVDEVVHVDEEHVAVLDLLLALHRVGALDEDVQRVKEVHQDRVVELVQLTLPVKVLQGVEPPDALVKCKNYVVTVYNLNSQRPGPVFVPT